MYAVHEVDGVVFSDTLIKFNSMVPEWPELQPRHFTAGHWWLVYDVDNDGPPVAFAGIVPFEPFPKTCYFKRCFVLPDHHGHGLQYRLMMARELKAKSLGFETLVSECGADNKYSAANFRKAGFEQCEPEQKWGAPNSVYWIKRI